MGGDLKEKSNDEERQRLVDRDKNGRKRGEDGMVRCSPGVDLSSNPNVTFVTASSIPELRYFQRLTICSYYQRWEILFIS